MPRYSDDSVDRVREAVDFADLVGSRVELRRAGAHRMVGLCPFHEERSPSFGINPDEKVYYCFGCRAGGDAFKWVMEVENVGFGEALELLADRYGVTLERSEEDPRAAQRRARRDRLLALLERTAAFYVRVLWEAPEAAHAREYLASRGLEEGMAREFRVGYSPSAWDRVLGASARAGYSLEEAFDAGLAQRSRGGGGAIDRFRGRLMFPWTDARGRVLGFGARALAAEQQPKYLNTAETDVFHKGRQVYGTQLARPAAAKAGAVVLVEGYTDVIALHQAGLRHAVGQMGTALTEGQAGELVKLASRVVLCLDADAAGQDAMAKAAAVMRSVKRDVDLRVVALPAGSDPADVVRRDGAEAMRALLDAAVPFPRWQVEHALAGGDTGTPEGREALLAETHRIIGPLPNGIVKQELIRTVADRLALSDALLESTFARPAPPRPAATGRLRPALAPPGRAPAPPAGDRRVPPAGGSSVPPQDPGGAVADDLGRLDDRGGGPGGGDAMAALIAADPGREGEEATGASAAPGPRPQQPTSDPALRALDVRAEVEVAFLALCVAFPVAGARRLAGADLDAMFSGAVARRAAEHLRTHADAPSSGLPPANDALAALIAELVIRAGELEDADPSALDSAALRLDLARLDRALASARAARSPVLDLAAERQRVLGEIRKVTV